MQLDNLERAALETVMRHPRPTHMIPNELRVPLQRLKSRGLAWEKSGNWMASDAGEDAYCVASALPPADNE